MHVDRLETVNERDQMIHAAMREWEDQIIFGGTMRGLHLKYFVLNPLKRNPYGHASRIAIKAYALHIKTENPELAANLISWLRRLEEENAVTTPGDRVKR